MPTYCFTSEAGNTIDRFYSTEDVPRRIKVDGILYRRDVGAEHRGWGRRNCATWPMYSIAAGVLPHQVKEAAAHDKELGVPTNYTADGRVEFRDKGHRRQWLKAHNMRDNDGGYSDG